jgi:hypothetical protein
MGVVTALAVLALLIGGAVYAVLQARSGERVALPFPFLFRAYLYLISGISLLVLVSGLGDLVRGGLAAGLGREFSYNPVYVPFGSRVAPRPVEVPPPPARPGEQPSLTAEERERLATEQRQREEQQRREGLRRAFQEGLSRGVSFTVIGGMVWGLHLWGRRRLEQGQAQEGDVPQRVYLLALLLIFSIITLVSLPTGVYDTFRFFLLDRPDYFHSPPGGRLATAIVALPFWGWYLSRAMQRLRAPRP